MNAPTLYFLAGMIVGMVVLFGAMALCSKNSSVGPAPERRVGICRRKRDRTAKMIDHIAGLHKIQALDYSQATHRIRALEIAADTAQRVLRTPAQSH